MARESVALAEVYPVLKSLDPARLEKAQAIEIPAGGKESPKRTFIELVKKARKASSAKKFASEVSKAAKLAEKGFTGLSLIESITITLSGPYAIIMVRFIFPGTLIISVPAEEVEGEDDES